MEVHKTGPDSVVFTVSTSLLHRDETEGEERMDAGVLQTLARQAMQAEGMQPEGPLQLQAFTAGGETMVFAAASCMKYGALFCFADMDDAIAAASALSHLGYTPDAVLIYFENAYYIALPDGGDEVFHHAGISALMSEFGAAVTREEGEYVRVTARGRRLIEADALRVLART